MINEEIVEELKEIITDIILDRQSELTGEGVEESEWHYDLILDNANQAREILREHS